MTGMRLYDQPDAQPQFEIQRISRGECQMYFHLDAAIDNRGYDDIALGDADNSSRNDVASA